MPVGIAATRMYASWIAIAILALSAAACSQSEPSADATSALDHGPQTAISKDSRDGDTPHDEKPPAAAVSGHQRMLTILREINAFMKQQSPMLGDGRLSALEQRLTASQQQDDLRGIFSGEVEIGRHHTAMGRGDDGIEHLQRAVKLLPKIRASFPEFVSKEQEGTLLFLAGLAALRKAENENCLYCEDGESCLFPISTSGVHTKREGSLLALHLFQRSLEVDPSNLRAIWLLNVTAMTLGKHPESVPEPFRIAANRVTTTDAFPRFRNIAAKLDLDTMSLAGGAIADDFDGDNQIDIVVSNWDTDGQLEFFRNRGDGSFQRQTEKANLVGIVGSLNLNHADFDNDGDLDLFVMRGGWLGTNGSFPNSLLENSGSGVFRDVTFESGLGVDFFPTQTSAWADYDNDGDLDLYVSNLGGPNRLYFNQGNGTFVDLAGESGVATPKNGFPAWFWDFNNDGNLDLYASSFEQGLEHIAGDYLGIEPKLGIDAHYLGDGKGGFIDVAQRIGLTAVTQPMGCNFGDLDNDGFLDFYLATGYPAVEGIMPNLMYLNDNGQSFVDVSNAGGFGHLQKGHGVAFADFDHDGDQDVLSELGGWCAGDRFQNALYENPGFDNNWIKIQLRGDDSNRFGVGARIRLVLGQGDSQRSIYRWVGYGSSFGGNPLRQEIGVGKTEVIDLLEVYWPRSGDSQQFKNVSVNQLIQIQETKADLEVIKINPVAFK